MKILTNYFDRVWFKLTNIKINCPKCKKEINKQYNYCPNCGFKIN